MLLPNVHDRMGSRVVVRRRWRAGREYSLTVLRPVFVWQDGQT